MTRNRLYLLLTLAIAGGYTYTVVMLLKHKAKLDITPCIIKNVTGIACPSCGSTRSVISIISGDIKGALFFNPLGFVIAIIMAIVPFWLLYDIAFKKSTLFVKYKLLEKTLQKKQVAITLIIIIAANWVWNIYKDL